MADDRGPQLTFWGTRGSIPVSGPGTVRHGGATSCVTLSEGSRSLVLDAGTGIRQYGLALPASPPGSRHTLLLSHLHWDHLAGLPFFPPLYEPGATVEVIGPDQPTATLAVVLDRLLEAAVWPLPPRAPLKITAVVPGAFEVAGFAVTAFRLAHAGVTLGYRITCQSGRIVSYVTDNEVGAMHPAQRQELVQLMAGCDVLIHDATWTDELLPERVGWGHSSATEAVALGLDVGCATVVLFHHDPDADDDALDRKVAAARQQVPGPGGPVVVTAVDGMILDL